MPVRRAKLQGLMIERGQTISRSLCHDKSQSDDTAGNVQSMQAGKNVEESALEGRWKIHACVHQLLPCCKLTRDEQYAKQRAEAQPSVHARDPILPNSGFCYFKSEAAQQKNERIRPEKRGQLNVLPRRHTPQ